MSLGKCFVVDVSVNGQNPICAIPIPVPDGLLGGFDDTALFDGADPADPDLMVISSNDQTVTFDYEVDFEPDDQLALRGLTGILPKGRRAVEFVVQFPLDMQDVFAVGLATNGATINGREAIDDGVNDLALVANSSGGTTTILSDFNGFAAGADVALANTDALGGPVAGGFVYRDHVCIVRNSSGLHRTYIFNKYDFRHVTGNTSTILSDLFGVADAWPAVTLDNVYWYSVTNELVVTANSQMYIMNLDDPLAGYVASQPFTATPRSISRDPVSLNWVVAESDDAVRVYDADFTELEVYAGLATAAANMSFYTSPIVGGNDWFIINVTGVTGTTAFYNRIDFIAGTLTDETLNVDATAINDNTNVATLAFCDAANRLLYEYDGNNLRIVAMEDTDVLAVAATETSRTYNVSLDDDTGTFTIRDNQGAYVTGAFAPGVSDVLYPFVFLFDTIQGQPPAVTIRQQTSRMVLAPLSGAVDYGPFSDRVADIQQLSSRWNHSLYVDEDGLVSAWGADNAGQSTVPALGVIIQVAAGGDLNTNGFSLALDEDGDITGWGNDTDSVLTNIPTATTYTFIAAGDRTAMAVTSAGAIVGWGLEQDDILANIPVLTDAVAISIGFGHAVALRENGQIEAWGRAVSDQIAIPTWLDHVIAIAAYWEGTAALLASGEIVTWGIVNNYGQGFSDKRYTRIAAGRYNLIGVLASGEIETIGDNAQGQLPVPANVGVVEDVATGFTGWYTTLSDTPCLVSFGSNANATATPPGLLTCALDEPLVSRFDNTWWEASTNVVWNAGENRWDIISGPGGDIELTPITTGPNVNWQVGFRPLQMTATFEIRTTDATDITVEMSLAGGNAFLSAGVDISPDSTVIVAGPLTFEIDQDFLFLDAQRDNGTTIDFSLVNLQFLVE